MVIGFVFFVIDKKICLNFFGPQMVISEKFECVYGANSG